MNAYCCIMAKGVGACHLAAELEIDVPNTGLHTSNSVRTTVARSLKREERKLCRLTYFDVVDNSNLLYSK